MITDFIAIKKELHKNFNISLRDEIRKRTPFIQSLNKNMQHEGSRMSYQTYERNEKEMDFKMAKSEFSATREEMSTMTFEDIKNKIVSMAEDFAKQMEGGMFADIFKELESTGNTIDGNPELSPEAILKALEKIYIDFEDDDRSKPSRPSLFVGPEAFAKLKESEAKATQEDMEKFKEREKEILDIKYAEYMEREGKRKMVE